MNYHFLKTRLHWYCFPIRIINSCHANKFNEVVKKLWGVKWRVVPTTVEIAKQKGMRRLKVAHCRDVE